MAQRLPSVASRVATVRSTRRRGCPGPQQEQGRRNLRGFIWSADTDRVELASAKNLVRGLNQLAKYERDLGAPAGSGQVWFYDPDAIANGIQVWWRVL